MALRSELHPLDAAVDHVRGGSAGRLVVEYGDYECPYSRQAFREIARFDRDRGGPSVVERIRRDIESGTATGEIRGTPTLFIDGVVHRGGFDAATLLEELAR